MARSRADTAKQPIDECLGIDQDEVKMNPSYAQIPLVE
jgi:hypothetical protein